MIEMKVGITGHQNLVDAEMWVMTTLRELFSIVTLKGDLREYEKQVGFQILEELNKRFQTKNQRIQNRQNRGRFYFSA